MGEGTNRIPRGDFHPAVEGGFESMLNATVLNLAQLIQSPEFQTAYVQMTTGGQAPVPAVPPTVPPTVAPPVTPPTTVEPQVTPPPPPLDSVSRPSVNRTRIPLPASTAPMVPATWNAERTETAPAA